ncbi:MULTISPECIES: Flp family type IVb pilin [Idiomarinaceae]|uniref:Flp pilus assembly pilin Flp n=2 Tax=Pseudidiomarina TaxID=2800384 RepID=A0A368ULZ2_9GAMM|nr:MULTISPECIES: pilus assembly protein [Idiomarinaceae]MRJ41851.1 pilus assembly protein [Idiomarina sp. FeN1]NCU57840.1 pilus assembly protein [Idiomarina sp. FenA--70]NCU60392.1 pilus assembly protein [Idiomarina sp. FenBw--71]PWW09850.1 hypothetical protein DET45_11641 [Pseudidiomarina maritima]RBP87778.1 hypothetical protein DFO81_11841 [Pseudidiomarina tainanensis]
MYHVICSRKPVRQFNKRLVRGQGMTEYIIIVALIAVAAIGVYSLLGETVRSQVAGIAAEVSGQSSNDAINHARSKARESKTLAQTKVTLGSYDETTGTGAN